MALSKQASSHNPKAALPRIRPLDPSIGQRDDRSIASILILKNLNLANEEVQIQALEVCMSFKNLYYAKAGVKLLRTRRIFTHTAFHSSPKSFSIVILKSSSGPSLVKHLVQSNLSLRGVPR